ncbi:MAG TPA: DegT/DnrJ/EryC1/StrS family aminotransferase [Stellaceae bacterium]|nr:DegT/DnrJ/EryC1/StrS family aminotransferase [Stellaceae bacterium]
MTVEPIPQTDPKAAYLAHKVDIDAAIARVLAGGRYILGAEVAAFEREFAGYIGVRHAVGVANGTDALVLALKAIGVTRDDYVVTVSHTAVASVAAIELAGAKPLLVDIDPATYTLDAEELARVLAAPPGRIAAVIPVHLYGQAADLDGILPLARRYGARVIEDCAQCHGATLSGRRLGSFGDIAAFSLYPTKNLAALGDGGIVVTDDDAAAERLRALREYGWHQRYVSDVAGMNSRLDELQAAILRVKLPALEADNARRRAVAAAYDAGLAALPLVLPARRPRSDHVFHQYAIRAKRRDALRDALAQRGIGTNIHYPVPVHRQPAYEGRLAQGPGGLANSERAAQEVLSLPMYPQLGDDAVAAVVAALRETARSQADRWP